VGTSPGVLEEKRCFFLIHLSWEEAQARGRRACVRTHGTRPACPCGLSHDNHCHGDGAPPRRDGAAPKAGSRSRLWEPRTPILDPSEADIGISGPPLAIWACVSKFLGLQVRVIHEADLEVACHSVS